MFYEVIPDRIFRADSDVLTYSGPENLPVGTLVRIPLGKTEANALIIKKFTQAPPFKTKEIINVLSAVPLPDHLISLLDFFQAYYLVPRPQTLSLILPIGLEKTRRSSTKLVSPPSKPAKYLDSGQNPSPSYPNKTAPNPPDSLKIPEIPLNSAQKQALGALQKAENPTKLLFGVTGSGKTNIYLKMAENALKTQKSTILLAPEIALTSQLVRVFSNFFGKNVILLHSRQTESERHQIWTKILQNPTPSIIIGPRSALFAPVKDLGLIIIDECHESSYFQDNSPHYSALRVASFLAKRLKITCLLGSATPSLSDYYLASRKKSLVFLKTPAKTSAVAPKVHLIDSKDKRAFKKNRYFSDVLLEKITENLQNHHQTLIFHNRRGSSPLSLCEHCGFEFLCPNCFLPLTLHSDSFELICHTCGFSEPVPHSCPSCGSPDILHKGFGTKLLESELRKLFRTAKIARFDADNKKSTSLDARYDEVRRGDVDIIIGTQTVAKGLDLPLLATVGIVQADAGLSLPDFSSEERTFELLTQVIGRVGRGHLSEASVFIQTFRPDHPVLQFAIRNDYESFAKYCLNSRRKSHFPPFSYLATVEITMKTEALVIKKITQLRDKLRTNNLLTLSPPEPAFHEHTSKGYTWRLVVRSSSRSTLLSALKNLDPNFRVTLDPPSLL